MTTFYEKLLEQYRVDRLTLLREAETLSPLNDAARLSEIYRDVHWLNGKISEREEEINKGEQQC